MKPKYESGKNISIARVEIYSQELLEAMNRLERQLFPEKTEYITEKTLKNVLKNKNVWVYVARDKGGKILGTATIAIFETPYESRAIIEDVVVDKDYRGQGIATALMNKLLITAKKEGVKRVKLNSHPHRLAANAMYQSLGYELLSTNTYQICI